MKKNLPLIAFWILGILWGSNFIYMKYATDYINPIQVVFLRVLFGFIPVLIYATYLRVLKFEHLKYSFHFFIMSLLGTSVYYYCFVKSTSLLLSGVSGALSGSIPIFAFLLAIIFIKEEKVTFSRSLGIIVGFMGVFLIAKPFSSDLSNTNIEGVFYIVLGSLVVGSSFVYAKKYISPLKMHFAALTTYQLGFAVVSLLLVTSFDNMENITKNTHIFLGTIFLLGVFGTGLAFIIYYYIIEKLGAVNAASVTYIPPVVALIIGYLFVGENITLLDIFSTVLIFSGVFLINKK